MNREILLWLDERKKRFKKKRIIISQVIRHEDLCNWEIIRKGQYVGIDGITSLLKYKRDLEYNSGWVIP